MFSGRCCYRDRRNLSQQLCNGLTEDCSMNGQLNLSPCTCVQSVFSPYRINKITLNRTVWFFSVNSRCGVARRSRSGVTELRSSYMVKKFNHVYYSHFNKIPACIGQTDGWTEMVNQDRAVSKMHCGPYGPYLLQKWYIRSICLITPVSMKSLFINVKDNTLFFINVDYWATF